MGNPISNFTWSNTQHMPIKFHQESAVAMLYASVNITQTLKRACDWKTSKVGKLSKKSNALDIIRYIGSAILFILNLK